MVSVNIVCACVCRVEEVETQTRVYALLSEIEIEMRRQFQATGYYMILWLSINNEHHYCYSLSLITALGISWPGPRLV